MNNEIKNLNIQDMNTVRKNRANYFPFGFENEMRPKFETFVNSQNQFPAVNIKENEDIAAELLEKIKSGVVAE